MAGNGLSHPATRRREPRASAIGRAQLPGRREIVSLVRRLFVIRVGPAAAVGALLVALIAIPLDLKLNVWIDESFTLHSTGAGPFVAWAQAVNFEAQPPLYFVLEGLWRMLDESSIGFARILSTLFAAAAVALIVAAAKALAPRVPPIFVALTVALNPTVIWTAAEMRVYALVMLVGAGLAWSFYEGFLIEARSRRAQLWYVLFAIAGMYTQYYVGFFLAAGGLTIVALRRGALKEYLVAAAAIVVAFVPFVPIALLHVRSSGEFIIATSLAESLHQIVDAVFVIVMPHYTGWAGLLKVGGFALAAAVVVALFALGRPPAPRGPAAVFAVQWLGALTIFVVLFHLLGAPLTLQKYVTVVAPSTMLLAFMFLSGLRRNRIIAGRLALATYAIFTGTDFWGEYRPPTIKPGDWQHVAQTVSSAGDKTPVAVFPPELAVPLSLYLPEPTIEIPRPMSFTLDYVRATTLTDERDVARVLDPIRATSPRLWLVTTGRCEDMPLNYYNYRCRYLDEYLARRYRLVRSVAFRGSLARLYVRFPLASADSQESRHAE